MKISPARIAAFDVLLRIETEGAFSSARLPAYEESLIPADRNLCHELVLGVLRKKLYLERIVLAASGGKKTDVEVRIALWLGLYQLLFLDRIPDHSAINDSVELIARARKRSAKGFVNAILRGAARERPAIIIQDEMDRLSVTTSHPRWLLERWETQFGRETAAAIAEANNEMPSISFRLLSDDVNIRPDWKMSNSVQSAYLANNIDASLRSLSEQRRIYFQDEGSQMVAHSVSVTPGGAFLDVCAAPGGKAGVIARFQPQGIGVAGDLHSSRVRFLKENLFLQGASGVSVVQYDAEKDLPFGSETFDAVLVDAPCSGTGTIRHNPEIRYSLVPDDISALSRKQHRILSNASKVVKRGGSLVYSTCSLEIAEGEDVAKAFLHENPDFRPERPNVPDRFQTRDGFARTWPHSDGMDGFFIAAFRKAE